MNIYCLVLKIVLKATSIKKNNGSFQTAKLSKCTYMSLALNTFMMEVAIIKKQTGWTQWTGFYMIGTSVMKQLVQDLIFFTNSRLGVQKL